jgi:hypothetical protein
VSLYLSLSLSACVCACELQDALQLRNDGAWEDLRAAAAMAAGHNRCVQCPLSLSLSLSLSLCLSVFDLQDTLQLRNGRTSGLPPPRLPLCEFLCVSCMCVLSSACFSHLHSLRNGIDFMIFPASYEFTVSFFFLFRLLAVLFFSLSLSASLPPLLLFTSPLCAPLCLDAVILSFFFSVFLSLTVFDHAVFACA